MNKKYLLLLLPLFVFVLGIFLTPNIALADPYADCYNEAIGQGYSNGGCEEFGCDPGDVLVTPNACLAPDECCGTPIAAGSVTQAEQDFCSLNASNSGYDSSNCRDLSCLGDEDDIGNCGDTNDHRCCAYSGVLTGGDEATEEDETGAAAGSGSYLVPQCAIEDPSSCGLCDLVQFIVDATQFLAGGVAAFALLFFIIGGFYWIFSAGNEQRVATGKKIMIGSITGVVIVFLAWIIVNTIILTVSTGGEEFGGTAELFPDAGPGSWFEVECKQYE